MSDSTEKPSTPTGAKRKRSTNTPSSPDPKASTPPAPGSSEKSSSTSKSSVVAWLKKITSPKSKGEKLKSPEPPKYPASSCRHPETPPESPIKESSPADAAVPSTSSQGYSVEDLDKNTIAEFLKSRTCYDVMPRSGKVSVFSVDLSVKQAANILLDRKIRCAPLWDSQKGTFVGMLTMTDFIEMFRGYYRSEERYAKVEKANLRAWMSMRGQTKELVKVHPNDNLLHAAKLLIEKRLHRIPVIDEYRNCNLVLSKKKLLHYIFNNMSTLKGMSFMKKSVGSLGIGTWEGLLRVRHDAKIIDALDLFCEKNFSCLPLVGYEVGSTMVTDALVKSSVFSFAEDIYKNLDMSLQQGIFERMPQNHDRTPICYFDDILEDVLKDFIDHRVRRIQAGRKPTETFNAIGIISLSDILRYLIPIRRLDSAPGEALQGAVGGSDLPNVEGAVGGSDLPNVEGAVGGSDPPISKFAEGLVLSGRPIEPQIIVRSPPKEDHSSD